MCQPLHHCIQQSGRAECAERLNTASPLSGSAVLEHQTDVLIAESVPASAKRNKRPYRTPPGLPCPTFAEPLFSFIFLPFCYIFLYEANSDAIPLRVLL